jgi:hypothetical protein
VVFVSYIYFEPVLLAVLDWVPFSYMLCLAFKINLLRVTNNWHNLIYKKTFFHLQEFDVFEFAWDLLSHRLIWVVHRLLKGISVLYSRLSEEQLEELVSAYNQEVETIEAQLESKRDKSKRSSINMRQSIIFSDSTATHLDESIAIYKESFSRGAKETGSMNSKRLEPITIKSPAPKREKSAQKKEK